MLLLLILFFFLVAAVPDIVAAIFVVTFPPVSVFDDVSPALDAAEFVVRHLAREDCLPFLRLFLTISFQTLEDQGHCQTLPRIPPLLMLGENMAPCFFRNMLSTCASAYHTNSSSIDSLPPPQVSKCWVYLRSSFMSLLLG